MVEISKTAPLVIIENGDAKVTPTKDVIEDVRGKISCHLNAISKMFAPGNKITLVVRNPGIENGDLVMSEGDFIEASQAILRLMAEVESESGKSIVLGAEKPASAISDGLATIGEMLITLPHKHLTERIRAAAVVTLGAEGKVSVLRAGMTSEQFEEDILPVLNRGKDSSEKALETKH